MRLVRLLPAIGSSARAVLHLAGATALGQAITILSTPLLTRLFMPEEFGELAGAVAIVSMVVVITSLRYEIAIPLPRDDREADSLVLLCAALTLLTTAITGLVFLLAGTQIAAALQAPALAPLLPLVLISLLGASAYQVLSMWAVRAQVYAQLARTRVWQGAAQVATQVGLGIAGFGAVALLLGDALGRTAGVTGLVRELLRQEGDRIRRISLGEIRAVAGRYRRFPMFSVPSAIANTATLQAPLILLLALYGTQVGGLFLVVHLVASLPIRLVGAAVAQVYFGEFSREAVSRPAELQGLFGSTVRRLAMIGIAPAIAAAFLAPTLFPLVFGHEWAEAGVYLGVLAPMYFLLFVSFPVSGTLDILERQDLSLVADVLGLAVTVGAILLAQASGMSPLHAVQAFGVAGAITALVHLGLAWLALRRRRPTKVGDA
jgi:O-antigen/teichoic acid export membrane protein